MLSRTKKILALGLSLSLLIPTSLSCRVCAKQESTPDTGCSRALADDIFDPCMVANTKCSLACKDARNGKVDTTPAFCGEHKFGEKPSRFLGCNEEFQKCIDKDCKFSYLKRTMPPMQMKLKDEAEEVKPDMGCSRALVNGIFDPCMLAKTECSLACYDALEGKVDTTPAFCGEYKVGEEPSHFLGCNEEFQKCMDKRLPFWEKWKSNNRFLKNNYFVFYFLTSTAGVCAVPTLGGILAGIPGFILSIPLAFAYELLLMVS